jgi:hypothetical protein
VSWSAEEELEALRFDFEPPCRQTPELYGTATVADGDLGHPHVLIVDQGVLGWMCVHGDGTLGVIAPERTDG